MGLKEMQILFDNQWATYYAGGTINGQLVLTLDAPKKVRDISIKFKGEAEVKWSENESHTNSQGNSESRWEDYTASETYFEYKFSALGNKGDTIEIPSGQHTYPFSHVLPPTLPSSFEGEHGHVRYTVKATLNRPWKFDQDCKTAFTVISPLDLNYNQEAKAPINLHKEKHVGICCCKSGPLIVSFKVPASGFVSGQVIPVAVEVENNTNTNVSQVECKLNKTVTFKATRPTQRQKVTKVAITDVKLGSIGAHGSNSWTHNITVPALPPSNLYNCSIIDLEYELKLSVKVSGLFYRGTSLSAPIIFGTVPLTQFYHPAEPLPVVNAPVLNASPGLGWMAPSGGVTTYPDLPPPTYEESLYSTARSIKDKDDTEHTLAAQGWLPRYPTYNFAPSAPPPS